MQPSTKPLIIWGKSERIYRNWIEGWGLQETEFSVSPYLVLRSLISKSCCLQDACDYRHEFTLPQSPIAGVPGDHSWKHSAAPSLEIMLTLSKDQLQLVPHPQDVMMHKHLSTALW